MIFFFFSSRRRHTRYWRDWSSDVCSSDLSLQKLKEMQSENGGFVWIKGAPEDRYMTQYILTGIGHLKQLGAVSTEQAKRSEERRVGKECRSRWSPYH